MWLQVGGLAVVSAGTMVTIVGIMELLGYIPALNVPTVALVVLKPGRILGVIEAAKFVCLMDSKISQAKLYQGEQ